MKRYEGLCYFSDDQPDNGQDLIEAFEDNKIIHLTPLIRYDDEDPLQNEYARGENDAVKVKISKIENKKVGELVITLKICEIHEFLNCGEYELIFHGNSNFLECINLPDEIFLF